MKSSTVNTLTFLISLTIFSSTASAQQITSFQPLQTTIQPGIIGQSIMGQPVEQFASQPKVCPATTTANRRCADQNGSKQRWSWHPDDADDQSIRIGI